MHAKDFRVPLRNAVAELEAARSACDDEGVDSCLAGVATQLEYYLEGDTTDPEARVYPPPGAVETMQERLDDVLERSGDSAGERVRNARSHLSVAVPALRERLNDGRRGDRF